MTIDQIRKRYIHNKDMIQQHCRAGDKIKVRSYEEIKETLNDGGDSLMSCIYFNYDEMRSKCGKYITIIENGIHNTYIAASINEHDPDAYHYEWSYEWLDVKEGVDAKKDWEVVI